MAGEDRPNALLAACCASEPPFMGGAGGALPVGIEGGGGGRGAADGGGGGGAGGACELKVGGAEGGGGGGGGACPDGFRNVGGGIGGFLPSGGGFGFEDAILVVDARRGSLAPRSPGRFGVDDVVLGVGLRPPFNAETVGFGAGPLGGIGGADPGTRGGAPGGFGAEPPGMAGVRRAGSGSERYGDSVSAPVRTPPDFRNLGIPPANMPPSCGAPPIEASDPPPTSLLALALPESGLDKPPGTGGAPNGDGAAALLTPPPTIGADLSFVTAFFNCRPFVMSVKSAPYSLSVGCSVP